MRSPLRALWNTRIIGSYLRFRVGLFLAGVLAVGAGVVMIGIGGIWGILALFTLILLFLLVTGFVVLVR
ncbi:hypothetical protein [Haloarchaeobius baliensis]|uniref:hypothetical protein n=1 Tax=Haloarchaeobius baliensis TaxID=1670458 RepID=UPI003F880A4B